MAWNLDGRVALITGGASGIGAELARQLAGRGMRLGLIDINQAPLGVVAAGLPGTETAVVDVRDAAGLEAAIDDLAGRLGGIDVAVANAGIATGGPLRLVARGLIAIRGVLDNPLTDRQMASGVAPMEEAFVAEAQRIGAAAAARAVGGR